MKKILPIFLLTLNSYAQNNFRPDLWFKTARDSSTSELNYVKPIKIENTDSVYRFKSKGNSVFYVYKPDSLHNSSVLNLISDKKLMSFKEKKIDKFNLQKETPKILNYYKSQTSGSRNSYLLLNDSINTTANVFEILYFKRRITEVEKSKINTYLSLKYGIDYRGIYTSSNNDTIFVDSQFQTRKIGLFKDLIFNYENSKSKFSIDSTIIIKLIDKQIVSDRKSDYILVSDNNKKFEFFNKNNTSYNKTFYTKRSWKAENLNLSSSNIYINIKESLISSDSLKTYLLYADDVEGLNYYRNASIVNAEILDSLSYKLNISDVKYFKFIKGLDQIFDYSYVYDCYTNTFNLQLFTNLIGDDFKLYSSNQLIKSNRFTANTYNIDNISEGNYKIKIADIFYDIDLKSPDNIELNIKNEYLINSNYDYVSIYPNQHQNLYAKYSWFFNDTLISEEPNFETNIPGNYTLKIKIDSCEYEKDFKVVDFSKNTWTIYPNPVGVNQIFAIDYKLINKENISVNIFDVQGRLIKSFNKTQTYNDSIPFTLSSSGVYIIKFTSESINSSQKLIVK